MQRTESVSQKEEPLDNNDAVEPRLVIVRYLNSEPALWECSTCGELFSVLSVSGIYVRFKDILAVFQEHCRSQHPMEKQ